MGARFFQRLFIRLESLFRAHSSASSTAGEPVTRCALASPMAGVPVTHRLDLEHIEQLLLFRRGMMSHVTAAPPTTVATNNSGITIYEGGGIRTLLGLFNGASAHLNMATPNLLLPAIHGHVTTYFNTLLCTSAASKTGSPTSGIPPVITLKPAFVYSVGVKRTFSSSTSTNDTNTHTAEWDAKLAACKADVTDWFAKKKAEDAAFLRYVSILVGSWCLIFWGCFSMLDSGSSQSDTNSCEGKNKSHCQAAASANRAVENPKV